MNKIGIIYKALNTLTNKVYIGQTIRGLKKRKQDHIYVSKSPPHSLYNTKFARALREYGEQAFIWECLYDNVSLDKLDELELKTIEKFDAIKNGYNSLPGFKNIYNKNKAESRNLVVSELTFNAMNTLIKDTGLKATEILGISLGLLRYLKNNDVKSLKMITENNKEIEILLPVDLTNG